MYGLVRGGKNKSAHTGARKCPVGDTVRSEHVSWGGEPGQGAAGAEASL